MLASDESAMRRRYPHKFRSRSRHELVQHHFIHRSEDKDKIFTPIYVKSDLFFKESLDLQFDAIECIWIEIRIKGNRFLFGFFYRPTYLYSIIYGRLGEWSKPFIEKYALYQSSVVCVLNLHGCSGSIF